MSHHIGKTISLQLQENPINISGKQSGYEGKTEYHLPCVNIGGSYYAAPYKDKDPFEIKTGQAFDFTCSIALYKKLVDYQKGELLDITMNKTADGIRYKIEGSSKEWTKAVEDTRSATDKPYGYNSVKERDITTQDNIRFGMAFNNATKLACTADELTIEEKVKFVAKIMPQMWEIVNCLDSLMEEPVQEVKDDDLPF
tara:strand:- start:2 stop:595 length:594 start_codon:yes stop_codon:yes gene_type:complete